MQYLLIFSSFLITAFGQPAWSSRLGPIASCVGLALFWKAILPIPQTKKRWVFATLWFMAVQVVQLSWLATPRYMGFLIIPFYLLLALGLGVQFGFLSCFIRPSLSWLQSLALAGGWVLCEWIRLFFLCGFTWNPLGLSLTSSLYSLQLASILGIFGLSFWVVLTNLAFLKKKSVWLGLALFPYLFGLVYQSWIEKQQEGSERMKVALVQTNLLPEEKELFDPLLSHSYIPPLEQWKQILQSLREVKGANLIVLPEAALPFGAHRAIYDLEMAQECFSVKDLPPLRRPYAVFFGGEWKVGNAFFVQALANQTKAHVITGLDDWDFKGRYNAAFHFSPNNLPYKRYEKQILAPMGEYIPLSQIKWFARWVGSHFKIYGSFDAGSEGKIFYAPHPVGIAICLEETFSGLVRNLRKKGAELLVSVSNDAFFPNTKLEEQHFHHGRVRAVENGVVLLRSCNAGITGGVDVTGKPLKLLSSQKTTGVTSFEVALFSQKTLYTFWGDLGILAPSLCFLGLYLITLKKRKGLKSVSSS